MSATPILAMIGALAVGTTLLGVSSAYVINEGHVGVKTRMGKAVSQETPQGLKFKAPLIEGIREFDVRERTITLPNMAGTTSNQVPIAVSVSVNWQPDAAQILPIFVNYGGPDEFAANVLLPRITQAVKATLGTFSSVQMAVERQPLADAMLRNIRSAMEAYPASFSSVQVDDYSLPDWYMSAVMTKEVQREKTAQAELALEQQNFEAQREVQSANAAAAATKAKATADAFATRERAKAEAEALRETASAQAEATRLQGEAEADSTAALAASLTPMVIEMARATGWDGSVPTTMMGGDAGNVVPLFNVNP